VKSANLQNVCHFIFREHSSAGTSLSIVLATYLQRVVILITWYVSQGKNDFGNF